MHKDYKCYFANQTRCFTCSSLLHEPWVSEKLGALQASSYVLSQLSLRLRVLKQFARIKRVTHSLTNKN